MKITLARIQLLIFLTVGLSVLSYVISEADWAIAILAIPAWALAWPVRFSSYGKPLSRSVLTLVVLAALAYSALRILENRHDIVIAVSRLMLWLQIVKLYDRWTLRDHRLILLMSAFLFIGALLTSNGLLLALVGIGYLPVLIWTVLLNELASVSARLSGDHETQLHRVIGSTRAHRDLIRLSIMIAGFSSLIAAGVFVIMPRGVGEGFLGEWETATTQHVTGFTDSVTLGSAGLLSDSPSPVLDVVLRDAAGRNIGSASRPLLLRGAILDAYTGGRWTRSQTAESREVQLTLAPGLSQPISQAMPRSPIQTLDITMRSRPNEHLFTMLRPVAITLDGGGPIAVGRTDQQIRSSVRGPIRYSVRFQPQDITSERLPPSFKVTSGSIRNLAVTLLDDAGIPADPAERAEGQTAEAADALLNYLHGNFGYTTQMIAAGVGEDPIEMFLFRTREGHCEYFASAMTAMCAGVGINARVITGYMAVEFDESSGAYLVRESNAHAWVEVQLEDGGWISLDPSPPDDLAIEHQPPRGFSASVRRIMDGVNRWWVTAVVGFNESRRRELVGRDPLHIERVSDSLAGAAMLPAEPGGRPIIVIAILRGVVAFGSVAAAGFGIVSLVSLFSHSRLRRRARANEFANDPEARERFLQRGFYMAALQALRRAGLEKPDWRPVKEHAHTLARIDTSLAEAISGIADLYYASRFGRRMLTEPEIREAEGRLSEVRKRLVELNSGAPRRWVR